MSDSGKTPEVSAASFTEHTNAEGRTYWYNTIDKTSVWEKPDALKTPFERALADTAWKEYTSRGRKYWVHKETKESVWNMPEELIFLLEKVTADTPAEPIKVDTPEPVAPSTPSAQNALVPVGFQGSPSHAQNQNQGQDSPYQSQQHQQQQQQHQQQEQSSFRPSFLPAAPAPVDRFVIPNGGWRTKEQAEDAFMYLLGKAGVDVGWTWDQTMRAIITDPLYKSFPSLAEKKAVFTKFIAEAKTKQSEEKEARLARIRAPFRSLLSDHPAIHSYTTFRTADSLFASNATWSSAKDASERLALFEEYIAEVKQKETVERRELRNRNILKLTSLLKTLSISISTRWRDAHDLVLRSDEWKRDEQLRGVDTLEVLILFEDYMKELEREHELAMRRKKLERSREGRRARDGFRALLQQLISQKKLTSKSRFKDGRALFATSDEYLDLLGHPGSTPLELFQDAIDDLEVKLEALTVDARDAYEKAGNPFVDATTRAEFDAVVGEKVEEGVRGEVFDFMKAKIIAKQVEEAKRAERKRRHLIEDLRYAIKRVEPPISLEATYEEALPSLSTLVPELEDDEDRRAAFVKFIKRQKEKLRDASPSRRHSKDGDVVMDYGGSSGRDDRRGSERERGGERGGERERERERAKSGRKDRERSEERERGGSAKRSRVSEPEGEREEGEI